MLAEFQDLKQTGIEILNWWSKDKNKVAAAAQKLLKTYFLLDSQVKGQYFQPKERALNLLKRAYIHILQYFQIHFPVYSLIIVWLDHPYILDILHIY